MDRPLFPDKTGGGLKSSLALKRGKWILHGLLASLVSTLPCLYARASKANPHSRLCLAKLVIPVNKRVLIGQYQYFPRVRTLICAICSVPRHHALKNNDKKKKKKREGRHPRAQILHVSQVVNYWTSPCVGGELACTKSLIHHLPSRRPGFASFLLFFVCFGFLPLLLHGPQITTSPSASFLFPPSLPHIFLPLLSASSCSIWLLAQLWWTWEESTASDLPPLPFLCFGRRRILVWS